MLTQREELDRCEDGVDATFLWTLHTGNMDMQLMLDEKRFPASFAKLDRDKDGEISKHEWMLAIDLALEIRLEALRGPARRSQAAGEAEDAAFREEFKKLARKVFFLIDTDGSNSLTEEEIVRSLRYEEEVKTFLATCGNPLLGHLLDPKEIKKVTEGDRQEQRRRDQSRGMGSDCREGPR